MSIYWISECHTGKQKNVMLVSNQNFRLFLVFWAISEILLSGWSRFLALPAQLPSLWDRSKFTNNNWYHRHPHIPQPFIVSLARAQNFQSLNFLLLLLYTPLKRPKSIRQKFILFLLLSLLFYFFRVFLHLRRLVGFIEVWVTTSLLLIRLTYHPWKRL